MKSNCILRFLTVFLALLHILPTCFAEPAHDLPSGYAIGHWEGDDAYYVTAHLLVQMDPLSTVMDARKRLEKIRWPALEAQGFEKVHCWAIISKRFDSLTQAEAFLGKPADSGNEPSAMTQLWTDLPVDMFDALTAIQVTYGNAEGNEINLNIAFGWPESQPPSSETALVRESTKVSESGFVMAAGYSPGVLPLHASIQFVQKEDVPLLMQEATQGDVIVYTLSSDDFTLEDLMAVIDTM